ncbi:MAG: NUDIX domain-containing protein [Candidatus Nanopelagicales bacterium]
MTDARKSQPQRRSKRYDEFSAGGLVVDTERGAAAIIGRRDRRGRMVWSFPKGHLEQGESAEQAAVREVLEETGLSAVVHAPLGDIVFWFMLDGKRIHKTVHHFLLIVTGGELSDADREVDAVEWVALADVHARLAYADERALLPKAVTLLEELG